MGGEHEIGIGLPCIGTANDIGRANDAAFLAYCHRALPHSHHVIGHVARLNKQALVCGHIIAGFSVKRCPKDHAVILRNRKYRDTAFAARGPFLKDLAQRHAFPIIGNPADFGFFVTGAFFVLENQKILSAKACP